MKAVYVLAAISLMAGCGSGDASRKSGELSDAAPDGSAASIAETFEDGLAGGWAPTDPGDEIHVSALDAARTALAAQNAAAEDWTVTAAAIQVVAGLNHRFDFRSPGGELHTVAVYEDLSGGLDVTVLRPSNSTR